MKPAARVRFSGDPFDQWRAAQVGAVIGFDKHGKAEFRFQTWDQYREFMMLNAKREEFEAKRKNRAGGHENKEAVRTQTS